MRHYEIVFLVYPNKSLYINDIIKYYSNIINNGDGVIHRLENWGLRYLAYSIKKYYKAHYILMNIEVSVHVMKKLKNDFKLNSSILRFIFIKKKCAIKKNSIMYLGDKNK